MKGRILIVDDNAENLYMLRMLLEGHSYEVMEATNGEEALAMARASVPDLVITDILMPVMDGFTLCREWKRDPALKDKPFIFYTATYTDPKDEEFALSLGAERFIIKPADPDSFIKSVEEVLKGMEAGAITLREMPPQDETLVLQRYNQRLIQKLEKKMADLERETARRRRSEERLRMLVDLFLGLGTDFRDNMARIVHLGARALEARAAFFARREKKRWFLVTVWDGMEERRPAELSEEGFPLSVFKGEERGPLVVEPLEPPLLSEWENLSREKGPPRSFIGMRLESGSVFGCFREETGTWGEDEKAIAVMLARALAIEEERLGNEERTKDFIDVASHEIRHPVTVVMGFARSLREWRDKLSEEEISDILEVIEYGCQRLVDLSSKLLDVAYIQRDRFKVCRERTDLEGLFRRWHEYAEKGRVKGRLRESRGPIRLYLAENLGEGWVDSQRLEELLDILVENAAKFSPPEQEIEVLVRRDDDLLQVEVADRGYGVPSEMRELIFEPFFQLEDASHHSVEGMGIGLHIARKIVEEHRGRIWCEPRQGGGSVFRFSLKV